MEIRNNTPISRSPNFGMALKKPKAEEMDAFVNYVTGGGERPLKLVKRGLRQIQKEQENNRFFDLDYMSDWRGHSAVRVSPRHDQGVESDLLEGKLFDSETKYPSKIQKTKAKMIADIENMEKKHPNSRFHQTLCAIRSFYRTAKMCVQAYINPKEVLPASLRKASDEATALAKQIEKNENQRKVRFQTIQNVFEK